MCNLYSQSQVACCLKSDREFLGEESWSEHFLLKSAGNQNEARKVAAQKNAIFEPEIFWDFLKGFPACSGINEDTR